MSKRLKNLRSKKILFISIIFLFLIQSFGYSDSMYWGIWETKKDIKQHIRITIKRKKRTTVEINSKIIEMEYNYVVSKFNNVLLEFKKNDYKKGGTESDESIYLIGGQINKQPVLQGFYSYTYYNKEGVGVKDLLKSITLYRIKTFKWND